MQPGKLIYLDGDEEVAIDCFVRDISEHGAGIECDQSYVLPKTVILQIGDERHRDTEIAWRLERRIGLRFRQSQRRRSVRRRQFKPARLVLGETGKTVDCRLRDISDHGAGIEFDAPQHVPPRVVLKISDEQQYDAEVVWQTERRVGLRFILKPPPRNVLDTLNEHRDILNNGAKGMLQVREDFRAGRYSHLNHPNIAAQLEHIVDSAHTLLQAVDGLIAACRDGDIDGDETAAGDTAGEVGAETDGAPAPTATPTEDQV